MMQTASSGTNTTTSQVTVQLTELVEQLDQQLPKPRVCSDGLSQTLTVQQFDSLTALW